MSDYISRQAVLSLPRSTTRNFRGEIVEESIDVADIESLPSAQTEPTLEQIEEYCRKRCLVIMTYELYNEMTRRWSSVRPEIIHCKNCMHWDELLNLCKRTKHMALGVNGFCSKAERRTPMTNKEAIDILWQYDVNFEPHPAEEVMHAIDLAIEALELVTIPDTAKDLKLQNSNDTISRQAAIDAHCELCGDRGKCSCDICPDVEVFQLLPSAQPDLDEWCTDCKEYDSERHCCPRFNRVIREAVEEVKKDDWIPCSERMPDEDYWTGAGTQHSAEVLMTVYSVADEKAIIDFGHTVDGKWYSDRTDCYVPNWWKVLAWMPLPKTWEGEKDENTKMANQAKMQRP